MNCKPGDFAFVVRSSNPENLMKIVEVLRAYDPSDCGIVTTAESRQVWLCESQGSELVWSDAAGTEFIRAKLGPIPDECLKRICPGQDEESVVETPGCPLLEGDAALQQ